MLLRDTKDGDLTTACFSMHMLIYTKGTLFHFHSHTELFQKIDFEVYKTMTFPGKQFTAGELQEILTEAGFKDITVTHTYAYYSIVSGTKP
jgi:hypothetical protein